MELSGGTEAFDEATLERFWRTIGEAEASPLGVGVGPTGSIEVILGVKGSADLIEKNLKYSETLDGRGLLHNQHEYSDRTLTINKGIRHIC
jgi:hypothetical protein